MTFNGTMFLMMFKFMDKWYQICCECKCKKEMSTQERCRKSLQLASMDSQRDDLNPNGFL